jgi:hypothetical protein
LGHHRKRSEALAAGILHQCALGVDLVGDVFAAGCLLNRQRSAAREGGVGGDSGATHGLGDVECNVTNRLSARRQGDLQTRNLGDFGGDSRATRSRSGGGWLAASHGVDGEEEVSGWR